MAGVVFLHTCRNCRKEVLQLQSYLNECVREARQHNAKAVIVRVSKHFKPELGNLVLQICEAEGWNPRQLKPESENDFSIIIKGI